MLQIRHDDEADDDHQEPGGDFVHRDHIPYVHLIRVLPGTKECRDVFCYPNEECGEDEAHVEGHPSAYAGNHGEMHPSFGVECKNDGDKKVSNVVYEVIREKVDVYRRAQNDAPYIGREAGDFHIKDAPRLSDVASHGSVHKSGEEWHGGNFEKCILRVAPRPNRWMCFKELEAQTHYVKEENSFHFIPGFYFREIENDLQEDGRYEEEVVPGNAEEWDMAGYKKEGEERARKNTRTGLFETE